MRGRLPLLLVSIFIAKILSAQSPFQFREAWLLELRMEQSGIEFYENRLQLAGRDSLTQIDSGLRRGAFEAAESSYRSILNNFRQNQGPTGIDVGWMLDHIGQSYLEIRDFEKAYQNLSEAAAIRRANIRSLELNPQQAALLTTCQSHLLKLLVALGRLDFAKGDLAPANQELAEAVTLANRLVRLQEAGNALYFRSLVLERQGKWSEAEGVWQEAAKIREKMTLSDPYWDMLKDMAGFYARHGDFHTATDIVKRIQTETARKELRPFMEIPGVPDWFHSGISIKDSSYVFKAEGEAAMAEILAMDRWLTDGPDAAAPFLAGRSFAAAALNERSSLRRGSDSDRARLLEYLTQRAFLHMSILLDGDPSPERVAQAYESIQRVKGGYLASIADVTTISESDRNNPSVSYNTAAGAPIMLDELASERTRHAHMFVESALDGKPFSSREFARSEQAEQAVTEGLGYAKRNQSGNQHPAPTDFVDPATVSIDITAWERIDRAHPTVSHREYGAFVVRKGQPAKYIRLGPADDIDRDVAALEATVVGAQVRGVRVNAAAQGVTADDSNQRLLFPA